MFTYELKLSSFKDLKRLPPDVQKRIIKKLDYFAKTVSPLSFADRLVNHEIGEYRFRIGDYRVVLIALKRLLLSLPLVIEEKYINEIKGLTKNFPPSSIQLTL